VVECKRGPRKGPRKGPDKGSNYALCTRAATPKGAKPKGSSRVMLVFT